MEREPYQSPTLESFNVSPDVKGRGVFFDTHETMKKNGELGEFVLKEFHLDLLFTPESAVDLFSKQEEEYELCAHYFPEEMIPKSVFLVSPEFVPQYEAAKLDIAKFYSYPKFVQIQLNRRLAGRYGLDDKASVKNSTFVNKALGHIGKFLEERHEKKTTGVLIQERIHGIAFATLMKKPDWKNQKLYPTLKQNVDKLILGLRTLYSEQPLAAFTWHSLESDNVMIETDEKGEITGRVVLIDTNFLLRPDQTYKQYSVNKLEKDVLDPLEQAFELS